MASATDSTSTMGGRRRKAPIIAIRDMKGALAVTGSAITVRSGECSPRKQQQAGNRDGNDEKV